MNSYFAVREKFNGEFDWCVSRYLPAFYNSFLPGEKLVFYEECHSSILAYQIADEFAELPREDQIKKIQELNPERGDLVPVVKIMYVVAGYVALGVSDGFAQKLYDLMVDILSAAPETPMEAVESKAMKIMFSDDDKSGGVGCQVPDWPKPPRQIGDFKQFPCLQS